MREDVRELIKYSMHAFSERSCSLSMNDPDSENVLLATSFKVAGHKLSDFIGTKRVEIKFSVDRYFNGVFRFHFRDS